MESLLGADVWIYHLSWDSSTRYSFTNGTYTWQAWPEADNIGKLYMHWQNHQNKDSGGQHSHEHEEMT
ncbi:hypothetical protein VB735_32260 [Halotia wernerae UHCC 0503]|nr:hypothetical protein [Halotia wernerae UHCC 0503]